MCVCVRERERERERESERRERETGRFEDSLVHSLNYTSKASLNNSSYTHLTITYFPEVEVWHVNSSIGIDILRRLDVHV